MKPRTFIVAVGAVAILAGIFVGTNRFSVSSNGISAECMSYFEKDSGVLNFESGVNSFTPGADLLSVKCESKKELFGMLTWALVAVGALMIVGGVVVRVRNSAEG
ncbi:hypothetical protein [Mycolicibacterium peregrinum]|nr:hypothetical protein [Mycolicibacterium peregrinum]